MNRHICPKSGLPMMQWWVGPCPGCKAEAQSPVLTGQGEEDRVQWGPTETDGAPNLGTVATDDVRSPFCSFCSACHPSRPCSPDCHICWPEISRLRSSLSAALKELAAAREELSTAKSVINEIIDIAHRHGWNGVENSKVLTHFLDHALPPTKELRRCKADRPIKQWFPDMPLKNLHDDDGSVCTHGLRDGLWDDYTEKRNAE